MNETEIENVWQMGKHAASYEYEYGVLPYPKPESDSSYAKWWMRGYNFTWRNYQRIEAQLALKSAQKSGSARPPEPGDLRETNQSTTTPPAG